MTYVWKRFTWQQARGSSGKAGQHVRDAHHKDNRGKTVEVGESFRALCGAKVIPRAEDMLKGACFAPTCQLCTVVLAKVLGWLPRELAILARRFEWDDDRIVHLAGMLGWTVEQVRRLVTSMPSGVTQ